MDDKIFIYLWNLLIPLVLIPVSIPMILEKIKPNWWYGFRTTKTLSDEKIWYPANKYAGKLMLASGIISLIGLVILYFLKNFFCLWTFNIIGWIITLVPITVAVIMSFVYLKKLK